jgi:16S rRNA G966 N2-methylase RsmD
MEEAGHPSKRRKLAGSGTSGPAPGSSTAPREADGRGRDNKKAQPFSVNKYLFQTHNGKKPKKCPLGSKLQSYWNKAARWGFMRWNECAVDAEGLFSLTPEKISLEIAQLVPGKCVLDCFCGLGGNAIGFARAGKRVTTVDYNATRLKLAQHNGSVYGASASCTSRQFSMHFKNDSPAAFNSHVSALSLYSFSFMFPGVLENTSFVCDTVQAYLRGLLDQQGPRFDCVFLDPPWGGSSPNCALLSTLLLSPPPLFHRLFHLFSTFISQEAHTTTGRSFGGWTIFSPVAPDYWTSCSMYWY